MASDDAHGAKRDHEKMLTDSSSATNYGTCSPFPEKQAERLSASRRGSLWAGSRKMAKPEPDVESDNEESDQPQAGSSHTSQEGKTEEKKEGKKEEGASRTKSNQRWMKLRTTVQLSGAISSTIQKSKPPLKREDSFLKRFSTRQIPDVQETIDTGDETDASNGLQDHDELWRRRLRRRRQSSRFVVNPDENFYFYWLMLVTVCVLYNLWTTIVRQSFPELQALQPLFWFTCDGTTDIVFILDVFVQFRTGYLEQGLMVYDWKKLAGHYTKSRDFLFDVLALLPLDLLQIFFGILPILRFPRFLKTYRVCDYYYIVESRTVYPNVWRVVNLVHILLILAHWFGCFYFLISEAEGFKGDWVYPYQPGDYSTLSRKYLGSLYWSTLTLTTIGDLPTPETNTELALTHDDDVTLNRTLLLLRMGLRNKSTPESRAAIAGLSRRGHKSRILHCRSNRRYVFTIVSYLIGVFIFATIVGQVGNVITNRNANRLEFERLLDGAKTYMRHHKVPGGMKRRVLRWYDYSWSRGRIQGGGDINTALGLLPDKLKTELALHVNLSVLKKVTIFQECQPEFLHDLVLKMKAYIFTPGDLICRKGEVAREMFIIADGILDVISDSGRVLTTMKPGDFFGEIGILNLDGLNKRTADVRSVGYSELFSLSREDVLAAMKDYPEAEEILQTLGRKRLMEARNASKMHKVKDQQGPNADGDATGKKIVEKLRSDVKGLKNVLRKSRRGNRSKDKQNVLQRMSHVQSSDDEEPVEPIGAGLPLLQRLKLLKEKERKEKGGSNLDPPSTPKPEKSETNFMSKRKPDVSVDAPGTSQAYKESGETVAKTVRTQIASTKVNKCPRSDVTTVDSKEDKSSGLFRGAFKKLQSKPASEAVELKPCTSSDTDDTPSEPGIKKKDTWGMIKKSAVLPRGRKFVSSCKSQVVQESQVERKIGRRSLKATVENIIRERRRTKSLGQVPKKPQHVDVNAWEFAEIADMQSNLNNKYNSVDDLSPEYSNLPFVRKLQILNERQAESELDLVVRSASLDVPDRNLVDDNTLIRSQSETSAMQHQVTPTPPTVLNLKKTADFIRRSDTIMERSQFYPSSPLVSPESNETLERRHLKSILKKLSAEEQEEGSAKKVSDQEMKDLLRAPTVEGYAARHSKLTKSVTFDNESLTTPLTSPLNPIPDTSSFLQQTHDDPFKGVIIGIKQVMQGHLNSIELKFHMKILKLQEEISRRDKIILMLQERLMTTQGTADYDVTQVLAAANETLIGNHFVTPSSASSLNAHPADFDFNKYQEDNAFRFTSLFSIQRVKNDHVELDSFLYRNPENRLARVRDQNDDNRRDYIAVQVGDEEVEESYSHKNWEAEMLAEELDKQTSLDRLSLDEMQTEVEALQKVVNKTDVDGLSPSEFRVLRTIIDNSDVALSHFSSSQLRKRKAFSFDMPVNSSQLTRDHEKTRHSLPTLPPTCYGSEDTWDEGSNDSVFEYELPPPPPSSSSSSSSCSIRRSATMLSSGHYSTSSVAANVEETEEQVEQDEAQDQ